MDEVGLDGWVKQTQDFKDHCFNIVFPKLNKVVFVPNFTNYDSLTPSKLNMYMCKSGTRIVVKCSQFEVKGH